MARIRSIHPGMFRDEGFASLSDHARVLLLAIGTTCDYADIFRADDVRALAVWSESAFCELVNADLVTLNGEFGEVLFAFGFSRRRISKWENLRSIVFRRDGYTCTYCGSADAPLHCDHVVPASRGGTNDPDNLTTACAFCNMSKGARTPQEWRQ